MKSLLERFRIRRLASTFTILATLSAGILIGSVVAHGVSGQEKTVNSSDATPLKVPAPVTLSTNFAKIAKEVGPAVVNINTITLPKQEQHSRRRGPMMREMPQGPDNGDNGDNGMQDFFNRFFGMGPQGPGQEEGGQEQQALGSGIIVDPRGYIVTNDHVVNKADQIYVKLTTDPVGNQGHKATVVGVDKDTDLAVIKINVGHPLPTVKMGNSDSAEVGDWVEAIGCPFALNQTVTAGIVSAKNRTQPGVAGQFQHFIQTDAAINPGNSGGPLLNMDGQVIGINTAIYTESGGYEGIGFAMPSNTVISVYNQLIGPEHKVVRGSIGIQFQENMPTAVSRVYGFKHGVLVSGVTAGQPADKAGVKVGDIVTSVNGQPVKDGDDLVNVISDKKPGTTVQLGILRNGKSMTLPVTITSRAKMMAALANGQGGNENGGTENGNSAQGKLGITVSDLPPNAPSGVSGVLIQSVKPGSFGEEAQLQPGLVITAINKQPIHNVQDYNRIVSGLKSGDDVVFQTIDPRQPHNGSFYSGGTLP